MKKVTNIFINKENLPIFHTEDGKCFKAHQNPTGNCWMLTFEEVEVEKEVDSSSDSKHIFKGNNLRCSKCGISVHEISGEDGKKKCPYRIDDCPKCK